MKDTCMFNDDLEVLAFAIVAAEANAQQAEAVLTEAETERTKIGSRISALEAERAAIITRRAGGDTRGEDGAQIALAVADMEGLQAMVPDADARLIAARASHQAAAREIGDARRAYDQAEKRTELVALDRHAERLITLLTETLQQRHAAAADLPAAQRFLSATTARLAALGRTMVGEIAAARQAVRSRSLPYAAEPTWKPCADLYHAVWTLHANGGRFV